MSPLVSPQMNDRNGLSGGLAKIFGAEEAVVIEGQREDKTHKEFWETLVCEPCEEKDREEEGRSRKLPHRYRMPTKHEVIAHVSSHWPFRIWCRHCVAGHAAGTHHKVRNDADR